MRFLQSGDLVITASTDQSLLAVDVETGKAKARKKEAHENAINRLAEAGPTLTASGGACRPGLGKWMQDGLGLAREKRGGVEVGVWNMYMEGCEAPL